MIMKLFLTTTLVLVGVNAQGLLDGILGGGSDGSTLLDTIFNNDKIKQALEENFNIGKEDIQGALNGINAQNEFNGILDASREDCSKARYRKVATQSKCASQPVGDMIDQKLTGGQATIDRLDQKKYATFVDVVGMCRVRQENEYYTWADLEKHMATKPSDVTPQTINQCKSLIRAEKAQCTQAAKIVCAMINGEHPACRTTAELRFGNLPFEDSCDTISRPLHAKALKEEQERLEKQAEEAEERRQKEREQQNASNAARSPARTPAPVTNSQRAVGTQDGTAEVSTGAGRNTALDAQLAAEVDRFEVAGGTRGRDN